MLDFAAALRRGTRATSATAAAARARVCVLDCLQCDGTGTVRLDPGRGNRPTRSGR
jgi:hypothetical protein